MPEVRIYLTVGFLLIAVVACQNPPPTTDQYDPEQVREEVTEAVQAFHAADTARNAKAVLALLWPEYSMFADGNRIRYADVAAGSPDFMANLAVFHTEWTDLEIIPLSDTAAVSSFLFQDSLVTLTGEVSKKKGPNTFLWTKRNGQWRVRYGDADHYPW